ncbi:hypothetical protein EVAR_91418_1 [Eumeta japonica]|uniref:Uncharacterized protein n=1 Tax=Eumeta variegata TaxID=151549 RepID=A0A4C1XBM6_EUMVA|nr:hypothetical protein EVAR_91418_1 [Eumeta japonica]
MRRIRNIIATSVPYDIYGRVCKSAAAESRERRHRQTTARVELAESRQVAASVPQTWRIIQKHARFRDDCLFARRGPKQDGDSEVSPIPLNYTSVRVPLLPPFRIIFHTSMKF